MSFFGFGRSNSDKNVTKEAITKDKVDRAALEALFKRYQDDDEEHPVISADGICQLCEDLDIDPTSDVRILYIAWKFGAEKGQQFTHQEFMRGMTELKCDSLDKLKQKLSEIEVELKNPARFRDFYRFVFQVSRDGLQKSIEKEIIVALLRMLFGQKYNQLDLLIQFLEEHRATRITNDQWNNILEFLIHVSMDLSEYEADGAWPLLIDEYVEWRRKDLALQQ